MVDCGGPKIGQKRGNLLEGTFTKFYSPRLHGIIFYSPIATKSTRSSSRRENGDEHGDYNENDNGNDNGDGGGNGNRNGLGGGNVNGNPNVNGNGGVDGQTRWFEKMETVFYISNCPPKYQVKYASYTLQNGALTWWNSHKRTIETDAAYAMTWKALMKLGLMG
ncbi:hypothetical protein Tco_0248155 [Tanacetum coccineum]